MENFSNAVSHRSCNGNVSNGFSRKKTVYDDVFGGPPKFGLPTLSPRVEDYSEIFGGFHALRSSLSIPVLDLPRVNEADVFFDVRSSKFDYSEVFGGFNNFDIGLSCEELFVQANGEDESSEDAWIPAEDEPLPEKSVTSIHYEKSPSLSEKYEVLSFDDIDQFNISHHEVNERTNYDILSGTQAIQEPITPKHAFVVDKIIPSEMMEYQDLSSKVTNNININSENIRRGVEGKRLKKNIPLRSYSQNDILHHDEMFVTVAEINLKTHPSHVPPPVRPPPPPVERRGSDDLALDHKGITCGTSPLFFDVEVDASSSAAASAAAMKEAMEEAQAKLNTAKRKEGLQSRAKLGLKSDLKVKHENIVVPYFAEGEEFFDVVEKSTYDRGTELCSSLESYNTEDAGEWTGTNDFFELVKTDKPRNSDGQRQLGVNGKSVGRVRKENKMTTAACELEENNKKVKAPEAANAASDFNKGKEEESEKSLKEIYEQEKTEKKQRDAYGKEENERRLKQALEQEENVKRLEEDFERQKSETIQKAREIEENEKKLIESFKQMEVEKRLKEVYEQEEILKKQKEAYEREEHERKLKEEAVLELEENEKKVKEEIERKKNEMVLKKAREIEEKEKKQREDLEREENENKLKEEIEYKNNELIQKKARERDENEKKLKEDLELLENEKKKKKQAIQREEYEKKSKEALEKEANEKKQAIQRMECEKRRKEASDREETEKRLREASKQENHENKLEEAWKVLENEKIIEEVNVQELTEKKPKQKKNTWEEGKKIIHDGLRGTRVLMEKETVNTSNASCKHELYRSTLEATQEKFMEEVSEKINELRDSKTVNKSGQLSEEENLDSIISYDAEDLEETLTPRRRGRKKNIGQDRVTFDHELNIDKFRPIQIVNEGVEKRNIKRLAQQLSTGKSTGGNGKNVKENYKYEEKEKEGRTIRETEMEHGRLRKLEEEREREREINERIKREKELEHERLRKLEEEQEREREINERMKREKELELDRLRKLEEEREREREIKERIKREKELEHERLRKLEEEREREREIKERMKREKELEHDRLRKLEERERERERKKEEQMKREKELDQERLRKLEEEEREREREREKDRMDVERVILEKESNEVRQRVMSDARERLDKACAYAREKSAAAKSSVEAKIRAERAVVERATAEARERAVEKSALEARERAERSSYTSVSRYSYPSTYTETEGESAQRCKAKLERHRRTTERAEKALAEKNARDLAVHREQAERNRLAESLDADVKRWSNGKERNLRALLSTLQYILGPDSGWQPVPLTDVITSAAVKKAYRKATLCVHPDKLQQRGASIRQKYICEKVFDLLKEAWNKFNSEER